MSGLGPCQFKMDVDKLERIQSRAARVVKGIDHVHVL